MSDDRDSHIMYPDRLAIILGDANVEFQCEPTSQIGEMQIIARLAADDGCLDIEELNKAAFEAVLRIANAALRFGSSELRGLLADEWRELAARAEAAEEAVRLLVEAGDACIIDPNNSCDGGPCDACRCAWQESCNGRARWLKWTAALRAAAALGLPEKPSTNLDLSGAESDEVGAKTEANKGGDRDGD